MNEPGKIEVEEVSAVPSAPRARVEVDERGQPVDREAAAAPAADTADAGRKPDYLDGFLAQKPNLAPGAGEPGGDLYEGVIDALKEIYDPEIPVNIYELGLIYGVDITQDAHVAVTMTLTTPHCPVAESMPGEVELRVGAVPGVGSAEVNLIWDPPWDPAKMSDEAKLELGML
ncbi:FeS assembly SUF system protein [Sphingomonas sp. Root710]|uniref:SUF system Fe-S cluster assembly protein n=1 Tax=Sphingomonas sp. Root710 TaxID=1736594 RepID=UPI0006FCDEA8|nr:SUF system Fe-S cluster assembly protein [Sphingomonas sp. Root710]KRB80965.1 FeS assembly SUF system protein [Sphingomonas sp. Root710]